MTQWYLRARIRSLLRARTAGHKFKARAPERDLETDRLRGESILRAINTALGSAEAEYAGLEKRIDDVLTKAVLDLGASELPVPPPSDGPSADMIEADALNAQRRLDDLAARIVQYKLLKAALLNGLPDLKPTT